MAENGGAEGNRTLKTKEKEDRLSALPDSLIHHILSFLPSTKEAVQTGILSKRWLNQWTFVSNLFFDLSDLCSDYLRDNIPLYTSIISGILNQTLVLHQCSKIHKFHFTTDRFSQCKYDPEYDPSYEDFIRFVVTKQPEELILKFSERSETMLPESFLCQPLLVKLQLTGCSIPPSGVLNWKSLKVLSLKNCNFADGLITSIVSGSPLLQSLEVVLVNFGLATLAIASTSLKRLVLVGVDCYVDILCPNLLEFYGSGMGMDLEKLLSNSLFLESLELYYFEFSNLRIASKVMKKLAFTGQISHEIAISCPNLEELWLSGSVQNIRLMNLPSSVRLTLNLEYREGLQENFAKQILESVQHTSELEFGINFIKALSAVEMDGISYPLLNAKCLTLNEYGRGHIFAHIAGIAFLLRSSPLLERLVVNLHKGLKHLRHEGVSVLDYSGENYWNSYGARFSSLVSNLRTVKITGFSQKEDKPKLVLDFVEFLLQNAKMLEKVVIVLKDCDVDFRCQVSQMVLSFRRCSAATVELHYAEDDEDDELL